MCESFESLIYNRICLTVLLMLQCFRACWHFARCLATSHMTLVIPVCSGNISGRLEIIFFCLFKVYIYIYIPTVENALKQTKDKWYYFETVDYRKFANNSDMCIHFCGILSKTSRFKEILFNKKFEFYFLFSTSLRNVFNSVRYLYGYAENG
jgi:hypothetical protein